MIQMRTWLAAALLALPATSMADMVLDWNQTGVATVLAARIPPAEGARAMAMMHIAVFDAVNAVDKRYKPYGADLDAPAGASPKAAAAAAAKTVLVKLFPEQREALEKTYSAALEKLSGESGILPGVALGERAGNACLEMRAGDGTGAPNLYRTATRPGVYVPTTLPAMYDWQKVRPFVMKQSSQFRPGPPPALKTATWTRDYNEIKELGGRTSAKRTAEQTEVGRFWAVTGVASWTPITRSLVAANPQRSLVQNARLFALVNMAAADALITVFDAKYHYNFWRPITAIRNGAIDGNDATAPEAGWVPLIETPMHPEYPCAHCISSSAVAAVLEAEFGAGEVPTMSMTSPTLPGVTRKWQRISDYSTEIQNARVWSGVHYRTSTVVGAKAGTAIGKYAVANAMVPAQ